MKFKGAEASNIQVLKSMRCLSYQCAEGNIPDMQLYKMLDELIELLKNFIIDSLSEYEKAEWG